MNRWCVAAIALLYSSDESLRIICAQLEAGIRIYVAEKQNRALSSLRGRRLFVVIL